MPATIFWGVKAPKLTRQKLNASWADDTTYTAGNDSGHTWNFGTGTDLQVFAQLNRFAYEIRRTIKLQDGTLKHYRAGTGTSTFRGIFTVEFTITTDTKPFLTYMKDFWNDQSPTIRYVMKPRPGSGTDEGMSDSYIVLPNGDWDFPHLKTVDGSDLWSIGMQGRIEMIATALKAIPASVLAPAGPP